MDQVLKEILDSEKQKLLNTINLIPSENFASKAVREAVGSVFMYKYSEGYPKKRYYEGNEQIDALESHTIELTLRTFGLEPGSWHANVQPLSGSIANMAVYNAILQPGDKIMSMFLPDGGHLSHGWSYDDSDTNGRNVRMSYAGGARKVSITSKFYNVIQYKTNPETHLLDYNFLENLASDERPKLIITGGTAYPREINYMRLSEIAKSAGAYYLADIAHEAGLIAAGALASPFNFADFVTFTTHKTLRGPKGAVILCKKEFSKKIDSSIFPGIQGGPHNGTIAGIAQSLAESATNEFKEYARRVLSNAKIFESELNNLDFKLVSGGTDKHLLVIDLTNKGINGRFASRALAHAGIITNMNTIPWENNPPKRPSGLRIGTPAITTRGMGENEIRKVSKWINEIINGSVKYADMKFEEFDMAVQKDDIVMEIKAEVEDLCRKFPFSF